MGRQARRVPLDFAHPMRETWPGFLNPHRPRQCATCDGSGLSPAARFFYAQWYGKVEFNPASMGSAPFGADHPSIVALAERNVQAASWCGPVKREAARLARDCFDSHWSHHLSQADVDALVDANRLVDFTHTFTPGKGWEPKDPPARPTAAQVNEWSLRGLGHDAVNQYVCVQARCEREGVPSQCAVCKGEGIDPSDAETARLCEEWTPTDPPTGDGWQMWETTSEGSPISPVFATPEELARWLADTGASAFGSHTASYRDWLAMILNGWAPSLIVRNGVTDSGVSAVAALERRRTEEN